MNPNRIKAFLAILLNASIIGLSYVFVKTGLKWSTPFDLLADRLIFACAALFLMRGLGLIKIEKIDKAKKLRLAGIALLYPIGFFAFQMFGVQLVPASEASLIYAALPIFTLLASSVFLNEKTVVRQKIGIGFSVLGVFYITMQSLSSLSAHYLGYLFIFCSLITMVAYFVFLKKAVQDIQVITITFYLIIYGTLLINGINIVKYAEAGHLTTYIQRFYISDYIYVVLYLGLLSTLGTSFLTNFSLKYLPASLVGVFNNLSPIIGLFSGVIILKETLHDYYIYGGIVVLIGIVMSTPKRKSV